MAIAGAALATAGLCMLAGGASPAGAAAPDTGAATPRAAAASLRSVGPIIRIPRPGLRRATSAWSTSSNWAGYDATGGTFTSVTATWTQPAVAPDVVLDKYAAFWVGLDGATDASQTVEQIGTVGITEGGVVRYVAWYEMYPAPMQQIGMVVHPGDRLTGTVRSNGSGSFTLSLVDQATGLTFTTTKKASTQYPALLASAEVIAETPSDGAGVLPLAKFGIVRFSGCAVNGQPVGTFSLDNITLATGGGKTLAVTSPLGADGASFFVSDDFKAPVTTAHRAGGMWHNAPAKLTLTAADGRFSSGVASTRYSLDGGATWTPGASLIIPAPTDHSNDGLHVVLYRSTDIAGNVEKRRAIKVGVDTQRPTPQAASPASVRRGQTATLRYSVVDPRPGSPIASVTIRIQDGAGRLVKKAVLGKRAVDTPLRHRFVCTLPKGTYRFSVHATDAAGNTQTASASNTLTVR